MALEDILKKIEEEANKEIENIVTVWDKKIKDEKETIDKKIKKMYEEEIQKIEKEIEQKERKRILDAKLEQRNTILKKKIEIINDIFSKVFDRVLKYDERKYFNIILDLIKKGSETGKEEIILNKKDKEKYGKKILESLKGQYKISEDTRNIKGGVILKDGNIETNLSLDFIFKDKREKLEQEVGKIVNVI